MELISGFQVQGESQNTGNFLIASFFMYKWPKI